MTRCAIVGQRKGKYLSEKDETGQQVLDKASTWINSLRCYHEQLDASPIPVIRHAIAKSDYVAVETDFGSSLLMIWLKFAYAGSKHIEMKHQ